MIFNETYIKGAYVIQLEKHDDERGSFARTWCRREFQQNGLQEQPVQANTAYSRARGTVRGLHYQVEPFAESKLVRCTRGGIFDVLVDLRPDSSTYTQWFGTELTPANGCMLYIPKGCAHGYQSTLDESDVFYLSTQFYAPECEKGFRWDDPAFNIDWPIATGVTLSDKDNSWPDFMPAPADRQ